MTDEVIVVGGGLAGLVCASRLSERGLLACVIDFPVEGTGSDLGGFAEFSGAKFSLLPAGGGLIEVAGSEQALAAALRATVELLQLSRFQLVQSRETALKSSNVPVLQLRGYSSYVLSPQEVLQVVGDLSNCIPSEKIVRSRVRSMHGTHDGKWLVRTSSSGDFIAARVVLATGRTGAALLRMLGAAEQVGKGLDLGVRLEFPDKNALEQLRSMGADAKVLMGNCRTFCLNSPGKIFRYVSDLGVSIPGGVVADETEAAANVGILCRVNAKYPALDRLRSSINHSSENELTYEIHSGDAVINATILEPLFGAEVVHALSEFTFQIEKAKLIDFTRGCMVHYPLVDWHWPTFGLPKSFSTSLPGVFAIGDLAGHARGLLQSAVAGWLMGGQLT